MENNNKYLQETIVLTRSTYEDKEGNVKNQYTVPIIRWNKETKRFEPTLVLINSTAEHFVLDRMIVKSNKSNKTGEIYFTEHQETPFDI